MTRASDPAGPPAGGLPVEKIDRPGAGHWQTRLGATRVRFGTGSLTGLGELARELGARRVLLVTDPGVRECGHVDRAVRYLRGGSVECHVFDGVGENPTTRHVEAGVEFSAALSIDLIVGLGGGSAMDAAKGINFLLTNGGRMEDYWGNGKARRPLLPSIGVPTTAGTGSEAQSYTLIEQAASRVKMACGDPKARFRVVILDPDLTASLPRGVAGRTGLDAISHTVESFVTIRRNPISQMFARQAFQLLDRGLPAVLEPSPRADVRGEMMLGAFLAGAAIECSMLGAAHACANPLTSRYEVPHGEAVLLMLPHVVRYNTPVVGSLYDDLGAGLAERLVELRALAGLPARLRDRGVPEDALPELAREASEQWTAGFNPRPVSIEDLQGLYEAAF